MSGTDAPEVVTLGEVMGLVIAADGRPLRQSGAFELSYAGAEATVAVGLARLGHRALLHTRLGDDAIGDRIVSELRRDGVDCSAVLRDDLAPTGLLVRDTTIDRPITVGYYRSTSAARRLRSEDLPVDAIGAARLLHLTGITAVLSRSARSATLAAADAARAAGVTVSLDPNVRRTLADDDQWRTVLSVLAERADLVLVGTDDARVLTDGDPASWFLDRGATTVVVKDGANGASETDGRSTCRVEAARVPLLDPVGAGDAFAAGWISGWLRGLSPADRLREASLVAGLAVAHRGDTTGLPDRATLDRLLDSQGDTLR